MERRNTGHLHDIDAPGLGRRKPYLGPFFHVVVLFIALFLFYPFVRTEVVGVGVIDVLCTAIFAATIYAVSRRRRDLIIAVALAVPGLTANWVTYLVPSVRLAMLGHACYAAFFLMTAAIILTAVFRSRRTTLDTIMGAVCVYFLMGMIWAYVFCFLELLHPGSFTSTTGHIAIQAGGPGLSDESDLIYFSFCTLTTLGYGDIVAVARPGRSMASLEAVIGQLYLAVLLTRLVALHILHTEQDKVEA
jgi:hypothetical protein